MIDMRNPIELTSANIMDQETNVHEKMLIYPEHIFSIMYMPANKATAVQTIAGGYQLVLESKETVAKLIAQVMTNQQTAGGEINE